MERSQGELIVLVVTDYAKTLPTQEIYMHALALKEIRQNWDQAWFETWDLFWLGGKGKGKNRAGKGGKGGKEGDDGRTEYEAMLHAEREIRNQNWEQKLQRWEQGSLGEKGFGKGKKKGYKGSSQDFVYIPTTIPGHKNKTFPFEVAWFAMTNLETQRGPVFNALMQQNPLQLEEVTKPTHSLEETREATRRSIKEFEKQEGKRGSKR